ncbi:MAG: bifunctional DNA-formamidopyrimidine glycosylase/DNA-(apurinic or apyrimidinic site) lyase [Rickettsiales bacterium]|nr:bifunctional DNA-formamidopyrimidine glycosylase/DNA-(apurinic or apyrimidinic site) lyase [Rickettsiales bacterium]
MPELPEVETVRCALAAAITKATIKRVVLRRQDLRMPFPKNLAAMLSGQTITAVERRAKYLLIQLSNKHTLIAHLGMTGRFSVIDKKPARFGAHDHVIWELSDGRWVIYNDARRFGLMTLCTAAQLSKHPLLAALGPEPFDPAFNAAYLENQLSRRSSSVKAAIMDQQVVVGVGNIYASEALFLAGILPDLPAKKVAKQAKTLVKTIHRVLSGAIKSGGSSLRDFYHVSGETGHFQHHFRVYDREGEPCFSCKNPIQSIRLSGRSSFFCAHCQS